MINQPSRGKQDQTIMTTGKALSIMASLIEKHDIGVNADVTVMDGIDALHVTLEAPNDSTISDVILINETTTKRDLEVRLHDMMWNFNADAEFDEHYSLESVIHRDLTPSGFITMLMEDQKYFKAKADDLYKTHTEENRPTSIKPITRTTHTPASASTITHATAYDQ